MTDSTPRWTPAPAELDDLECLLLGAYGVAHRFADPGNSPFVGPTLLVPVEVAKAAERASSLVLLDEEGTPVGTVSAERVWSPLPTSDREGDWAGIAGLVTPLRPLERGEHQHATRPAPGRAGSDAPATLVAPVDLPPTKPHLVALQACAQGSAARLVVLPLVGQGHPRYVDGGGLVRAWTAVAKCNDLEIVPVPVPAHGDEDRDRALALAASVAYGATLVPAPLRAADGRPATVDLPLVTPGQRGDWRLDAAGRPATVVAQEVLDAALRGGEVPPGTIPAATWREIRRASRPDGGRGVTVLLTGLSGSGKSTIARALAAALLDTTGRSVTLLDGDVVRRMLSSGLGFSRPDRELNVRRIGYVASEITRHGGIAICAPIAPYAATRAQVRAMVERHGGFLLVHVATPLEVCEARDRKGLYALARQGRLPEFTGVSDPYEEPVDAELRIDASEVPVGEAVERVLATLRRAGWLTGADR